MLGVGVHRSHYTPEGIMENRTFSVNFPYSEMVKEIDYCGLVSGEKLTNSEEQYLTQGKPDIKKWNPHYLLCRTTATGL